MTAETTETAAITIPVGRFHIAYDVFLGYRAPDEDVRRPVEDQDEIRALYRRKARGWQPVQVEIPRGIREIGRAAFECCRGLTAVSIPDTIAVIGDNAFAGCTALTKATLPDSVTEIGNRAFADCTALTEAAIPNGVAKISPRTFTNCAALTKAVLPDGVTGIGKEAFRGCTALTHVRVPDTVKTMGDSAFAGCTALQEITLPEALSGQARRIFGDLEQISFRWFSGKLQVNPALAAVLEADLKKRRWSIGEKVVAAEDGETLDKYLALWDKVPLDFLEELIEMSVKARKTGITAILLQYKNSHFAQRQLEAAYQRQEEKEIGLRSRSQADWRRLYIFHEEDGGIVITGCRKSSGVVVVPARIGDKPVVAVDRWTPRRGTEPDTAYSVVLPEGLQEIREAAFQGCSMETITIPSTVKRIGERAFCKCRYLVRADIPNGVLCIKDQVFYGCDALQTVTIPESVTEIHLDAFRECPNLKKLVLPADIRTVHRWYWGQWWWGARQPELYVPAGSRTMLTLRREDISCCLV